MVAEGVAGIPLVDLSEPLSRGVCSNPRLVGLTSGENRPGDAGEFVGERDRQHVAVQPLRCLLDPGHRPRFAALGRRTRTTCAETGLVVSL